MIFLPKLASKKGNKTLTYSSYYGRFIAVSSKCSLFYFLLRNLNSELCSDLNNEINVLPMLLVPSILFNFCGTKKK
jgi:hypothetical protein